MLDKAVVGSKNYWRWVLFLLVTAGIGFSFYLLQLERGLTVTGLNNDVTWGLYIGQFTFFVGVAASAVMVVLPYYIHNVKEFGRITVVGEFLAIAAVIMCLLFIIVDMGMPQRLINMILHPTPNSPMFWDMIVLNGYLFLNLIVGWNVLESERKGINPPKWVKPFIYISIPWAVSIHTVTAFLYQGLPGKTFWETALIAPKFLASAFATGPALLILICLILKKFADFDAGQKAIQKLATIVTYGLIISLFLIVSEFFTAYFSQVPSHMYALDYLFFGIGEHTMMVPIMMLFLVLSITALVILLNPKARKNETTLIIACVSVFFAMFIEKGLAFIVAGLTPNPMGHVTVYIPTLTEAMVSLGIWAIGALILTVLYKIAVSVKREAGNLHDVSAEKKADM
ncbi:molybdopterin-containing oxidoreductase family membrane subunit [Desulfitispora alkaliphila]|uniref:sulfate reduction electron transfer complex DsrMKJOP subunit DsrP n=1 Tax=Desulfitispora alkaliphila TaxID=622674 RepID=UPI003D1FDE26